MRLMIDEMVECEKARYDRLYLEQPAYGGTSPELLLLREVPEEFVSRTELGAKCLVVGSGSGQGVRWLRGSGFKCWACDVSSSTVAYYRDAPQFFQVCPAHRIAHDAGQFDLVVCCDVLEHIPEPAVRPSLGEILRICKSHGRMILQAHTQANSCFEPGLHVTIKPHEWWANRFQEMGHVLWTRRTSLWEAAVVEKC